MQLAFIPELIEWSRAYYNGAPIVTDEVFNAKIEELRELCPDHPILTTTGWGATDPDWDVPHWSHVAGLNQHKIEDLPDDHQWEGTKMVKLDGLTGVLRYSAEGHLIDVLTRGTGDHGKDITEMALATGDVPWVFTNHANEPIQIRGEFVMSWDSFKRMVDGGLSKEDTHPRNVAAGCMNGSDRVKALFVDFVAFSVCDKDGNPLPDAAEICRELDITFVDSEPFTSKAQMQKVWDDSWKGSVYDYPTDGIVLADSEGKAQWKVKFPSEDVQEMVVGTIELRKTRTGRIVPHCTFKDPKFISGCWIRHCTLNNLTWCKSAFDLPIWEGSRVMVRRANEIIPEIVTVLSGVEVPCDEVLAAKAGLKPSDVFWDGTDLKFDSDDWRVANTVERILCSALPKGYGASLLDPVMMSIKSVVGIVSGIEDEVSIADLGRWITMVKDEERRTIIKHSMSLTPSLADGFDKFVDWLIKPIDVATLLHFVCMNGVGESKLGDLTKAALKAYGENPALASDSMRRHHLLLGVVSTVHPKYCSIFDSLMAIYGQELSWLTPGWLKEPEKVDESQIKGRFSMTGKIDGMKKDALAEIAKAAGWIWDDKNYDIMVSDAERMSAKMQAAKAAGKDPMTSAAFLTHINAVMV